MPIGYAVDHERRIVFVRAWGTVVDATLRAQARALKNDSRLDSDFSLLVDSRNVTGHAVTLALLQTYPTPFSKHARRAIVVGDVYGLALAQVYCGWTAGEESALVTRCLEEAFEWLKLPPDSEPPDHLDATFGVPESWAAFVPAPEASNRLDR